MPDLKVPEGNTTLVCICTDAALDKRECGMVARAATAGIARAVDPDLHPGGRRRRLLPGLGRRGERAPVRPRCRSAPPRRPRPPPRSATASPSSARPSGPRSRPGDPASLRGCPARSRPRRWCCAASATARPTASSTCTPRRGGGSGAIAKGSRRPKSRFGGRLEPFFRLDLVLYEGRGDLLDRDRAPRRWTGTARLRARRRARCRPRGGPATRCCGCSTPARRTSPPTTCSAATWRCSTPTRRWRARPGPALAFRLKLALAAGFSPELASCARCGEAEHLTSFSGAAGGVVCASCEGGGFPLHRGGAPVHGGGAGAAAGGGAGGRAAGWRPRRTARSTETLEHHAHVHLRAAASRG